MLWTGSRFPALIDDIVNSDRVVYGVTTGFGSLCRSIFPKKTVPSSRKT